jgi:hypothetical protein
VAELLSLHLQVSGVVRVQVGDERYAAHHLQAVAFQPRDLAGVVRDDLHLAHAEVVKDLRADPVVALVDRETKLQIRLDRIGAAILQLVRAQFVGEADAATFLVQIEEDTAPRSRDDVQRTVSLRSAPSGRGR